MPKPMKFEDKMNRLNEITEKLDDENIDLELSIKLYEEGVELCKELQEQLKKFEDKVNSINKENHE